VLTTDGEFHSFARQLRRLEEDGLAEATRVKVAPFADFAERFAAAAAEGGHDLVFFSQVFFNSGHAVQDLGALVGAVPDAAAVIVIDGYHGFLALPTDLAAVEGRAFYLAGGYKYAMAGEGAAFLHAPPGRGLRPRDTGWFASFGTLEAEDDGPVPYAAGGARFLGATFDPVGLYRFNAVMDWLDGLGLTVAAIHAHVRALQRRFVAGLAALGRDSLHPGRLVVPVEAAASAALGPAIFAMVAMGSPRGRESTAQGLLGSISTIALVVASVVGGALFDRDMSWPFLFFVVGIAICLVLGLLVWRGGAQRSVTRPEPVPEVAPELRG